jgi:hypothetical protein
VSKCIYDTRTSDKCHADNPLTSVPNVLPHLETPNRQAIDSAGRRPQQNRKACDDFITDHVGSRVTAQIILRFAIHVSMAGRRWTTAISHKQPASLQSCPGTVRNSFLLARWKGCVSDLLLCGSFASAFQVVIFISVNCKNVVTVDLVICLVREKCAWISLSNSGSYLNYAWCA